MDRGALQFRLLCDPMDFSPPGSSCGYWDVLQPVNSENNDMGGV